jgi:hypothetical protein
MNTDLSKKYGHLLADFVNSNGTDEAVLSFLSGLQRQFSFSMDFFESARNQFPSTNTITASLNDLEKEFLKLILKKKEIVDQLNDQFKLISYGIEDYDPLTKTISMTSLQLNRDTVGGVTGDNQTGLAEPNGGGFLQTLKMLGLSIVDGPVSIKIDAIKGEIENLLGPLAAGQILNLIMAGHEIEELILKCGDDKYNDLQMLAEEHREVFNFHIKIERFQNDCAETLRMVIDGRPFHDIPTLGSYLEIYNRVGSHRMIIGDKNRLIPVFSTDEGQFIAEDEIQGWIETLEKIIAFCLIEFLKSEKSRKHLKKCRTCSSYFIARQPKTQKFCRKRCRINKDRTP